MPLNDRLRGVIDWLAAGYPAGIPPKDYVPVLALLRRRLTEDEVRQVAAEVAAMASPVPDPTDIGVGITRVTDALPSAADVARVEARLSEHHDWPGGTP